jgi:hypothetical protein
MNLRSKLRRLEVLAPHGQCRKPLVIGPPEIFPGERSAVEAWCREQAASPCLVGAGCHDCPDPKRRGCSVLLMVGEGV